MKKNLKFWTQITKPGILIKVTKKLEGLRGLSNFYILSTKNLTNTKTLPFGWNIFVILNVFVINTVKVA